MLSLIILTRYGRDFLFLTPSLERLMRNRLIYKNLLESITHWARCVNPSLIGGPHKLRGDGEKCSLCKQHGGMRAGTINSGRLDRIPRTTWHADIFVLLISKLCWIVCTVHSMISFWPKDVKCDIKFINLSSLLPSMLFLILNCVLHL